LKVEANNGIRGSPLGGNPKLKVVGLVKEAPLSVQYIRILGILYVVEGTKTISEGLIIRLKLPIKEKRHNLTYYLRKIAMMNTNTYLALEKKSQISSLKLMRKN